MSDPSFTRHHPKIPTKVRAMLFSLAACFLLPSGSHSVEMKGRVAFSGAVGGKVERYSPNYFYGIRGNATEDQDDSFSYYFPDDDCYGDDCSNRGGVIRFWGATGLESEGAAKAQLLGGTLSMERFGSRRNAFGKYTGRIFAFFELNGEEYVRWGTVSVRLRKNVLRTPFGRLKLGRRIHDHPLNQKQNFRGHGIIHVNVWLR